MNTQRYTKEQIEFIKSEMGDLLYFFGYTNCDEQSKTNFFTFDEHSQEHEELYNGFKRVNDESMQEILQKPR